MTIAPGLLPEGLRDRLPPEAEAMTLLLRGIADGFAAYGYERVQPPLAEYEASIARWLGKPLETTLFRSPDPVSGEALAFRPDITGQVARIAATRMASAPRPLRLSYAGPVLRARASQLDPARERVQAGAEYIGDDDVAVIAELISAAVDALTAAGVSDITVDLTTPELVQMLASETWPVGDLSRLVTALDGKDWGALDAADLAPYRALLEAAGPAETALPHLRRIAPDLTDRLAALVAALPTARISIDPTERHGFEYQSWVGFSLFGEAGGAPLRGEIGRGGAYRIRHPEGGDEAAAGVSLYVDALVDAGLGARPPRRVFLPLGTPAEVARALRADGWATVAALSPADSDTGCSHRWTGSAILAKS